MRVEYEKGAAIKYLSHLDVARAWERLLRRSKLQVALTKGFNPHFRVSLGTVLPVGVWGKREYLDFFMEEELPAGEIKSRLAGLAPLGLTINKLQEVSQDLPSLMSSINAAHYRMVLVPGQVDVVKIIEELNHRQQIRVTRRRSNQQVDIKPGVYFLGVGKGSDGQVIDAFLANSSQLTVRLFDLVEVLAGYGVPRSDIVDMWREGTYLKKDQLYSSPM